MSAVSPTQSPARWRPWHLWRQAALWAERLPQTATTALLLLIVGICSYGLLAGQLGFYWDDWYSVWAVEALGPEAVRAGFASDRPLVGNAHAILLPLIGLSPLAWHWLSLSMRWLAAVLFYWALRGIWPHHRLQTAAAAVLFLVYPGFLQQSVSLSYGINVLPPLVLYLLSLGLQIHNLRRAQPAPVVTALSVVVSLAGAVQVEYFLGLELFRIPLVWWLLAPEGDWQRRLRRTALHVLPYVGNVALVTLWHIAVLDHVAPDHRQVSAYLADLWPESLAEVGIRLTTIVSDLYQAAVMAWGRVLSGGISAESLGPATAAGGLTGLYLMYVGLARRGQPAPAAAWPRPALLLGATALVFGQLPLWLADRHVSWTNALDRHTLPAMFGVSLGLAAGVQRLSRSPRTVAALIGFAVALAAGYQYQLGRNFAMDWQREKSFLWQMAWRVPALAPGTTFLVHFEPASLPQPKDYTLALPLNLVYASQPASTQLEHWAYVQEAPYRSEWFRLLVPGAPAQYQRELRNLTFSGDVVNSLVVVFTSTGCMRVLDPARVEVPNLPLMVEAARARSNLGVIVAAPGATHVPPHHIFGAEPGHGWCYYFQKADLARQQGDWEQVALLAAELGPLELSPRDQTEWLPFIEGYLALERYDEARALVDRIFPARPVTDPQSSNRLATRRALCDLLHRLAQRSQPPGLADVHLDFTQRLNCDHP